MRKLLPSFNVCVVRCLCCPIEYVVCVYLLGALHFLGAVHLLGDHSTMIRDGATGATTEGVSLFFVYICPTFLSRYLRPFLPREGFSRPLPRQR